MNEHGELVQVPITYEWRPTVCDNCKLVGHSTIECRKGKTKRIWVQKKQQVQNHTEVVAPEVDQEGFQRTLRPIRVRPTNLVPTPVVNSFQMLNDDGGHSACSTAELDREDDIEEVGLLEHKVKLPNLGKLYQRVFPNWCFSSNASYHNGGRIILAWNPGSFSVSIQAASSQFMHCFIQPVSGMPSFFCTFIYAFNDSSNREVLWKDLKSLNTQDAWILCGDFNCVMSTDERVGSPYRNAEIMDSCDCMHFCSMEDIKSVGKFYTWNNKQHGATRVFSKIDRIMANPKWLGVYSSAEVCFMNEGCFGHSPGLLTVYPRDTGGEKPFKYFTMWKSAPHFLILI
ncbi:uncharacterized protein [Spinacia oleracea]|uniref:Endonuclease/exonuclease/phosphatase domain-containing protein n=1 Tax=Spinacia oleracea TaxID=3562 RepID=A0ABM3R7T3_SPIOL|nr:uncharacterized protein LOC130467244 [Spinacia oleracea]